MYWTYDLFGEKQYHVDISRMEKFMFLKNDIISCVPSIPIPISITTTISDSAMIDSTSTTATTAVATPAPTTTTELSVLDKCALRLDIVYKCQDPLFWSLFVAKYGKKEYDRIGKQNGNVEMKEKKAMAEQFQTLGASKLNTLLKTKLTKTKCLEMASEIMTLPKMRWAHLYIICMYFDCNIYLVDTDKKVYMTYFRENPENYDTFVIYRNKGKGQPYWIDTSEQIMKLSDIPNQYLWIASYEKPFKSASNYKVSELQTMIKLVGLSLCETKLKKQDLYDTIAVHCAESLQ